MTAQTEEAGQTSSGEPLTPVVVLGDEVVSSRALTEVERHMVNELASKHFWGPLARIVATSTLGLMGAVLYVLHGDERWLAATLLAIGLLVRGRGQLPALRRGLALRQDRLLRQLLVFESRRGRCERLAGSGLLWRRDGQDAPWRSELT